MSQAFQPGAFQADAFQVTFIALAESPTRWTIGRETRNISIGENRTWAIGYENRKASIGRIT